MKIFHHSPVALSFAQALLELGNERNLAEALGAELGQLRQVVTENRTFGSYLYDPAVGQDERAGKLKRVLGGQVNPLLMNFLLVLNERGRAGLLPQVAAAFDELLARQQGRVEVDVTVARELAADQLDEVRQRVSAALGKKAVIRQRVDESIVGGMILQVEDQQIDGSVRTQLQVLKEQLLAARHR